MSAGRWLAIAASVVIVATIVAGIVAMGPPSVQRELRLDEHRVRDLQEIETLVHLHHREQGRLPPDLSALARHPGWSVPGADPVTGEPYGYAATGARRYRLCAVFATDTAERDGRRAPGWREPEWGHPAGRHCFARELPEPTKTR